MFGQTGICRVLCRRDEKASGRCDKETWT
ncbi:MAG: hypothetical protein E7301_00550 [Butyrivibrio sp.]|nr:hypothetical protein [Butyrivibrio sp.]